MIGYGPEDNHFVAELTYNYGIKSYKLGNGFHVSKGLVKQFVYVLFLIFCANILCLFNYRYIIYFFKVTSIEFNLVTLTRA